MRCKKLREREKEEERPRTLGDLSNAGNGSRGGGTNPLDWRQARFDITVRSPTARAVSRKEKQFMRNTRTILATWPHARLPREFFRSAGEPTRGTQPPLDTLRRAEVPAVACDFSSPSREANEQTNERTNERTDVPAV